jgi:hypothetical protein
MTSVKLERWIKALKAAQRAEQLSQSDRRMIRSLIRWLGSPKPRIGRTRAERRRWFMWRTVERIGYALLKSYDLLKFIAKLINDQN